MHPSFLVRQTIEKHPFRAVCRVHICPRTDAGYPSCMHACWFSLFVARQVLIKNFQINPRSHGLIMSVTFLLYIFLGAYANETLTPHCANKLAACKSFALEQPFLHPNNFTVYHYASFHDFFLHAQANFNKGSKFKNAIAEYQCVSQSHFAILQTYQANNYKI